ncbi:hypothetical protein [Thiomicrorhabdus indica]|uniref:hypothetical protein n=1 Tax=Thiomicrorhabdus indica TaxID=2267253 RepID=UPI002AA959C1|nr:hypothetical protein [Thiomicrorhabdus indica]
MVENYKELYLMLQEVAKLIHEELGEVCEFQLAKNGSCMLEHKSTGRRLVFMMAKLGEEQKVGYAFFEANEKQPDWIDDLPAGQFSQDVAKNLVNNELINASSDY